MVEQDTTVKENINNILEHNYYLLKKSDITNKAFKSNTEKFHQIIFIIEGELECTIDRQNYYLFTNDIIIIPPYITYNLHESNLKHYTDYYVLWISPKYVDILSSKEICWSLTSISKQDVTVISNTEISNINFCLKGLLDNQLSKPSDNIIGDSYLNIILNQLYIMHNTNNLNDGIDDKYDLIKEVITYIDDNLATNLSLDNISNHFYINKYTLIRQFKEYMNCTVYSYIISKRIMLSKRMLKSGKSASDVYELCGFSTYANFYKAFLLNTGCTPSDYSRLHHFKNKN